MVSCALWVAVVVMDFLLHGETFRVMEKTLTNSGPFMESTGKHSIYTLKAVIARANSG